MSDEKLREELRAAFSKVVDAETATQILNCIAPVCERAINEEVGAHSNEKLREELARSGRELRIEYEHRLHRSPDVADYVGAFEPIIQRAVQEAVAGAFLAINEHMPMLQAAIDPVGHFGITGECACGNFCWDKEFGLIPWIDHLQKTLPAAARAAFDEAVKREVEIATAKLQTQLAGCSTAALGWNGSPAKMGDYGWSPAYQDVLNLRNRNDALIAELEAFHAKWHPRTQFADELAAVIAKHKPQPAAEGE